MAKRPELMVMSGELSGKRFPVPETGLRLGRSSSNDLHLPDEELSRNHCLFEADGEDGIRVLDLASANGTFVNGEPLGATARKLSVGDRIEVGSSLLVVVGEGESVPAPKAVAAPAPDGAVDLGLGPAKPASGEGVAAKAPADPAQLRKRKIVNLIWAGAATSLVVCIGLMLTNRNAANRIGGLLGITGEPPPAEEPAPEASPLCVEYERVEASTDRIVRYHASIYEQAVDLTYEVKTFSGEDQKVERKGSLSTITTNALTKVLESEAWRNVRSESGGEDESRHESWTVTTVRNGEVRTVSLLNRDPEGVFKDLVLTLESDVNSDLQVSAMMRTPQERLEAGLEFERQGDDKVEHSEVSKDNLYLGVSNLRKARTELEGLTGTEAVDAYRRVRGKLAEAEKRLEAKYRELSELAEYECKNRAWSRAIGVYDEIRRVIPDRDDERCARAEAQIRYCEGQIREANAKEKGARR